MMPDYDRAARMAYKSLLSLHIEEFPVNPLLILSYCRNTVVRTYDEIAPLFGYSDPAEFRWYIANNQDALTIRNDSGGIVRYELFYDSHGNPLRRRFTLAHELGHIVLKHHMEEYWEEKEADYYASQLLAPRPVFDLFKKHGMALTPDFISSAFSVSRSAAENTLAPSRHHRDAFLDQEIRRQFDAAVEFMYIMQ